MADKILITSELIKELDRFIFKQLHLHHTWKPTHKNFNGNNHLRLQQGMRNFHINNNGWQDIGHHLALMPDGKWVTGRPFSKTPASIKSWNIGALSVEMVGNFDIRGTGVYNDAGYDVLEGPQKASVLSLIKYFGDKYGYSRIVFHREGPEVSKTCPGTSLNKASLIREARNQTGTPNPDPKPEPFDPNSKKTWERYINGGIVRELQMELNRQFGKGLEVDGWFGDLTIAALVNVRRGAIGNITRIIQDRLKALGYDIGRFGRDGIFGADTDRAVRQFQRDKNLTVDGVVGRNTWKALFKK